MPLKVRKNKSPDVPHDCPLTSCMSVLGGAWTPNIIWNLCGGPRRFSELQVDIPMISAKVLTTRLRDLEEKGVVSRDVKPTSPPSVEYALTDLGEQLIPVIESIVKVGHEIKQRRDKDKKSAA
jgi:DNA-binding HxlR family transcriptional regulator